MILVVGGAGYIGSHCVKELVKSHKVVVLDNLSTGHRWAVDHQAIFIKGDLGDSKIVQHIFDTYPIDAVMHFAAYSLVGESMQNPLKYYENNVAATLNLLKMMQENYVNNFVFSSTAAVYGIPNADIIDENTETCPINPYGHSKIMVEQMIKDFSESYSLNYTILRYFNAAGADESATIGECHTPETHLIPLVLQHLLEQRESISVFGTDYETPDGTCIRDYIHVTDLAIAHKLVLNQLLLGNKLNTVYNLGNGDGYSVQQIINLCENLLNKKANVYYTDRRIGDPAKLVADANKIYNELGWKATKDLESIIKDAYKWHMRNLEN